MMQMVKKSPATKDSEVYISAVVWPQVWLDS
jgi:hypothetical protein